MEQATASKNGTRLLTFIMNLAAFCFFISLAIHVAALLGVILSRHAIFMHVGIFVVFPPAVFVARRLSKDAPRKDFWKITLRNCPPWMRVAFKVIFGYAIINFIIFAIATRHVPKSHYSSKIISLADFKVFSGHWMAFYFAAFAILYSATHERKSPQASPASDEGLSG